MQAIDEVKGSSLRLVKPIKSLKTGRERTLMETKEYYTQVEQYAQQIRNAGTTDEIIDLLDIVLSETRDLKLSDEVCAAREQVKLAENKIESMKHELEQLRAIVQIDQMTGAYNRRGFEEIFCKEAARADRNAQSLCVVMIDLDNFKQINDNFGHQFGDNVLIRFSKVSKDTLRPSDTIARFGGEEFVILLPDIEIDEAITVIHRLQSNFSNDRAFKLKRHSMPITFSAGVAIRSFGEHQNSVISRADQALYQAKRSGKNRAIPAIL